MNELEPLEPESTLAYRIQSRGDIATFATKLTASQEVSTLFPKPLVLVSKAVSYHIIAISSLIVGKTAFLYVLLVLRLQTRLPTIFQSEETHLYYFDDNGVFRMTTELIATDFTSRF